ncbi:hypothetical protein Patl_1525 [Paraglaciecola sp. T6c]|uniref:hypothetical protein n=1 Tax=Pseudoalteromonas atlantica (strain T6c / ATCC BAA-1087) TaxID=3042615 RepID=UPI0000DA6DC1|nr:hypothetical protein [Paraglaciecola sp. T6c]ABG40047.1 hypothetical protein Patl_1525 [Paraglaciecola sp. T6c]
MINSVANIKVKAKALYLKALVSRPLIAVLSILLCAISTPALAHEGHVDKDAQFACSEKALRESCEYMKQIDEKSAKLYSGYCQKISHTKMCVRNQPIKTIVLEPLEN